MFGLHDLAEYQLGSIIALGWVEDWAGFPAWVRQQAVFSNWSGLYAGFWLLDAAVG